MHYTDYFREGYMAMSLQYIQHNFVRELKKNGTKDRLH